MFTTAALELAERREAQLESDVDTTPVEYVIRYNCGHQRPHSGTAESINDSVFHFEDGVLTVPVDCSECLVIIEAPAQGPALAFDDVDCPF